MVTLAIYMFAQFCTVCLNVGVLKFWSVWTQFCRFLLSEGHFSVVWGHFLLTGSLPVPPSFRFPLFGPFVASLPPPLSSLPSFPVRHFPSLGLFSSLICHNHFQHLFEFLTLPNLSASFWNRLLHTHWVLVGYALVSCGVLSWFCLATHCSTAHQFPSVWLFFRGVFIPDIF